MGHSMRLAGIPMLVGAIAVAIVAGCGGSSHTSLRSARSGDAIAIDAALDGLDPRLVATPLEAGQWALELEIGRRESPDRAAIAEEARRIAWVSFIVMRPGAERVDSLTRAWVDIDTTAGSRAMPVYTGVKWVPRGLAEGDEYVMMTIRTDRGVVVRSTPLFSELTRGYDSTRLALSIVLDDTSAGVRLTRRMPPSADEFIARGGGMRLTLFDAGGRLVRAWRQEPAQSMPHPVLPDRIGDTLTVRFPFDWRVAPMGDTLPDGRYRFVGELVALPRSYTTELEITKGGRQQD